jgi:hypothetical protein
MVHQPQDPLALGGSKGQDLEHFRHRLCKVGLSGDLHLPRGTHRVDRLGGVVEEELVDRGRGDELVDGGEDFSLRKWVCL